MAAASSGQALLGCANSSHHFRQAHDIGLTGTLHVNHNLRHFHHALLPFMQTGTGFGQCQQYLQRSHNAITRGVGIQTE